MEKTAPLLIDSSGHESFSNLARLFGAEIVQNTIVVPAKAGKGVIKKLQVNRGMEVRAWEVSLNEPLEIVRTIANAEVGPFTLVYVFKGNFLMRSGVSSEIKLKGEANLLFNSGNKEIYCTILPEETRVLVIRIERKWLTEEFDKPNAKFYEGLTSLTPDDHKFIHFQKIAAADYAKALELFEHLLSDKMDMLYVNGSLFLLLSNFFKSLISADDVSRDRYNVLHYNKMIEVERILMGNILQQFPPVQEIAQQVAMSESTLKRRFKLMYGMGLNDYYLKKKMDLARNELMRNSFSVKEVAFMFGYESSASFIRIFKKYHNYAPGKLQKKVVKS